MITAICGVIAVLLQGVNVFLYLSIRVAILESEARTMTWAGGEFVRKEVCKYRGRIESTHLAGPPVLQGQDPNPA